MTQTFLELKGFAVPAFRAPAVASPIVVVIPDDFDREHAAWLHEHGLDVPMTEQQINDVIHYELCVEV